MCVLVVVVVVLWCVWWKETANKDERREEPQMPSGSVLRWGGKRLDNSSE